jgi:hypothetical protein
MNIADVKKTVMPTRVKIDKNASFGLTELGKVHCEDYLGDGGIALDILSYLDDHGPSRIRGIAKDLDMSEDDTKEVLKRLVSNGYVRTVIGNT